jgi:hypothetical protein
MYWAWRDQVIGLLLGSVRNTGKKLSLSPPLGCCGHVLRYRQPRLVPRFFCILRMLKSVVSANCAIFATNCIGVGGRLKRLPHDLATCDPFACRTVLALNRKKSRGEDRKTPIVNQHLGDVLWHVMNHFAKRKI